MTNGLAPRRFPREERALVLRRPLPARRSKMPAGGATVGIDFIGDRLEAVVHPRLGAIRDPGRHVVERDLNLADEEFSVALKEHPFR